MDSHVALVTGASSGIGQAIALELARADYRVFGTSRQPHGRSDSSQPFALIPLDVRSASSAQAAVESVLDQAGRIDVLVNNAGIAVSGALEETDLEDFAAQFDTNLFGAVRVTQAVLPTMRRQRRGRIINVGSILGEVAPPFVGAYAASKFALSGLSEASRAELRPFGIYVSLVEPAFVRSNLVSTAPAQTIGEYDAWRGPALAAARAGVQRGMDPRVVAAVVLEIVRASSPRLRYTVGRDARLLSVAKRALPEPWFEVFARRAFGGGAASASKASGAELVSQPR